MTSILGLLVQILKLLNQIYQQNVQILTGQQLEQAGIKELATKQQLVLNDVAKLQADLEIIKKVLGIGVPISETMIFGAPQP